MFVKVKKLREDAVIPSYAKQGDAGLDLVGTHIISNTDTQITYGTGLAFEIPEGYVGLIYPRSSIRKYQVMLSNSVGVVDSGYRGEVQATFNKLNGAHSISYSTGERIVQLIIVPYPTVTLIQSDELSDSERGQGGFGSSGK